MNIKDVLDYFDLYCNSKLKCKEYLKENDIKKDKLLFAHFKKYQFLFLFPYLGFLTIYNITNLLDSIDIIKINTDNSKLFNTYFKLPKALRIKIPIIYNVFISEREIPYNIINDIYKIPLIIGGGGEKNRLIIIGLNEKKIFINNRFDPFPFIFKDNFSKILDEKSKYELDKKMFKLIHKLIINV